MTDARQVLLQAKAVLVVDWPSRDVPETLARAGYSVVVKGGPKPKNFVAIEIIGDEMVRRPLGRALDQVDLVYCHRPVDELRELAQLATSLGARTLWLQSGQTAQGGKDPKGCWLPEQVAREAVAIANSFGLALVASSYIADVVRSLGR